MTLSIELSRHGVEIEGVTILRPKGMSPSEWVWFWEIVQKIARGEDIDLALDEDGKFTFDC